MSTVMLGWGPGWWFLGAGFMVICMLMMARMMGGMGHGHSEHGGHAGSDDPERTLADRLARGEIDVEEYERLLGALRAPTTRHDLRQAANSGPPEPKNS